MEKKTENYIQMVHRKMDSINNQIKFSKEVDPDFKTGMISDGYHTFDELYKHRIRNYMTVCKLVSDIYASLLRTKESPVWMSEKHSDGSVWDGWFILGIFSEPGEQITYHLPTSKWDECKRFAKVVDQAPEYDGHTSADVLERLSKL